MVKLPFWCKIAKFCDKIDYPPRRIQIFNSQGVKSATLQRHKQHLLPDYQQCYTPLLIVISLLWKAPQKTRKHPFLTTKCIKNHYHCPQNRLKWQEKALFRIFLLLFRGGQLATSTLAHHKKTPGAVIEIIDYLRPCHQPPLHPTFFSSPWSMTWKIFNSHGVNLSTATTKNTTFGPITTQPPQPQRMARSS